MSLFMLGRASKFGVQQEYALKHNFFMPYESTLEVAADIVDPLLLGAGAIATMCVAVVEGFKAIISFLQSDLTGAKSSIKDAGLFLSFALIFVSEMMISPLTSVMSLIGRLTATVGEELSPGRVTIE